MQAVQLCHGKDVVNATPLSLFNDHNNISLWNFIARQANLWQYLFMIRRRLDNIDTLILEKLQAEGRITNVDLAAHAGITAPPCLRRVRALEETGFIKGYHADISPEAMGFSISVFAMVRLKSQAEEDLQAFEKHISGLPEVRECHMLNGEIDFILKIVSTDLQAFQKLLTTQITSAPNVASVKTSLTIRTSKWQPGVPVRSAPVS
jgi:DNA-binding Lrp family transcriptional regulator